MKQYKKLKDTWVTKETYKNITGQFGGTPNNGQVYGAYDIGYGYPLINSLGCQGSSCASCQGQYCTRCPNMNQRKVKMIG